VASEFSDPGSIPGASTNFLRDPARLTLRSVACCESVAELRDRCVTYLLRMASRKTGFDRFFDEQMRDPSFARGYRHARNEIDAVDRIIRALDAARIDLGISKAELARQISAKPEIVRRLLTAKAPNPTLSTVVKIAAALGYTVQLVPAKPRPRRRRAA
jgi:ribosome-binding protein aMBF1 (putative translation factor)